MKKAIAMKWAYALESGEYRQTKSALEFDNAFCCLGVLCKIAQKEKIPVNTVAKSSRRLYGGDLDIQPEVLKWSRMKSFSGRLPNSTKLGSLVNLNDEGSSFKEIAKIIRKYWRYL